MVSALCFPLSLQSLASCERDARSSGSRAEPSLSMSGVHALLFSMQCLFYPLLDCCLVAIPADNPLGVTWLATESKHVLMWSNRRCRFPVW